MTQFGIWVGGEKNIGYIENVENLHYDPYKQSIEAVKMYIDRPLTFFGRDDELLRLDTLLDKHENVLLLNGIGGIGKTTVAKEYYHRYATKYDSLIWLDYRESLFDSFMSKNMQSYFHIIKLAQSAEEAFMSVIKVLSQIEGNNLFVIDNLSNINDFIKYERYLPKNWKCLVTSRSNIEEMRHFILIG